MSSDHCVCMMGKGISGANGRGSGDHHVHVKVKIPKKLTQRQRALIAEYAEDEAILEERLMASPIQKLENSSQVYEARPSPKRISLPRPNVSMPSRSSERHVTYPKISIARRIVAGVELRCIRRA